MEQSYTARCIKQYNAHTMNHNDSKVIMIGNNLCDVFTGMGWNTQTRCRKVGGKWCVVSGAPIAVARLDALK